MRKMRGSTGMRKEIPRKTRGIAGAEVGIGNIGVGV